MKSLEKAIKFCDHLGKTKGWQKDYFVVLSKDENEIPGNDFHVADSSELDTFYSGCKIIHAANSR